jgi:hypothetical protein
MAPLMMPIFPPLPLPAHPGGSWCAGATLGEIVIAPNAISENDNVNVFWNLAVTPHIILYFPSCSFS